MVLCLPLSIMCHGVWAMPLQFRLPGPNFGMRAAHPIIMPPLPALAGLSHAKALTHVWPRLEENPAHHERWCMGLMQGLLDVERASGEVQI